jgi:hypothetical protein
MYILIGGNPFRGYTNTLTYTDLKVVDRVDTKKQAVASFRKHYDDCGGLLRVMDSETFTFVDMEELENA